MENYRLQSVLFDRSTFNEHDANEWLTSHNLKNKGVDIKDKYLRYRQLNPAYLRRLGYTEYRSININKNILYIIAYKKNKYITHTKCPI
jgi:hypothetical protein